MNTSYSTEYPGINQAAFDLIVHNAQTLLTYIYAHRDQKPYDQAEIRIGLAIKILIKSDRDSYDSQLLEPIIEDLENLLADKAYLAQFSNPKLKHEYLSKQLVLISKFKQLDDTISLNTLSIRGLGLP